jgi:hypothetical protein
MKADIQREASISPLKKSKILQTTLSKIWHALRGKLVCILSILIPLIPIGVCPHLDGFKHSQTKDRLPGLTEQQQL